MRHICIAVIAASTLALGQSASGADMPVKAPRPPAQVYGWTGCYVGANAGGIWDHDSVPDTLFDPKDVSTAAFLAGAIPNSYSYDRSRWLAGGQLGCNYQVTNWVLGLESDFDGTNLSGDQTINTAVPGFFPTTSTVTQKTDWIGTTRGRLGVAASNFLLYATGGVAYGHVSDSYFLSNVAAGGPVSSFASDSATLVGWTAGGGLEYGLGQWSIKGEALYYNLGDHALDRACTLVGGAPCATPNSINTVHFENRGVIARAGLNYHFNLAK